MWPDLNEATGRNREQGFSTGGHERQQILHAVRSCNEYQDGDVLPNP